MRHFLLAMTVLAALGAKAQNQRQPNIMGQILDASTNEALSFATVSLLDPSDSTLVKGAATDLDGKFELSVRPGSYLLQTNFVTYKSITMEINLERGKPLNLSPIKMESADLNLDEVVVEAERTQMQLNVDKKVFSVGKDLSNLGGTATDILDNLPSVTVDVEGNIELRGSSNVRILIDGKPSGLVGLSSSDALRQIQANLIDRIEVITNPSARYDAAGQAGIINIVLKKDRKKGINGSFQANTGAPHNHGISGNVNLRRDWVNFFINYGLNYRRAPGQGNAFQEFTFPDTSYTTNLNRYQSRGGISNSVRFGSDFFLSDKDVITTAFLYRYADENNRAELEFSDFDVNGVLLNNTLREDDESEGDENLEYSINYTRSFQRKGHQFTFDFQYQDNNETEASDIVQSNGPTPNERASELNQKVSNDEGEKRLMIQSDYIQPFGQNGKYELGFRSTLRDIKNIYLVQEQGPDGTFIDLDTFSTDFAYDENVHAAYGIISDEFGKLSWQTGLRMEITDIDTRFAETGEAFTWDYTNFFPSAFLTYKFSGLQQLQLSYSRRINRPRFRELNPFSSFTDNRNFRVGNPNLQPEYTDSYEFGLLQNIKEATIYTGVYYRNTTQLIQRVTLPPTENGERVRIPENIGSENAFGLEMNITQDITKWYRINGNVNFFRSETSGTIGDTTNLAALATSFTTRLSNNFKLKRIFDAQINVNYRAPRQTTQGRRLAITVIDMGLSRDLLNGNGTLAASLRDVFNSRRWRSETELDNFYEESEFQWRRGPNFILTFTYRLNQKKPRGRSRGQRGRDFDGGDGF